jgi:hypothetical protein
MTITERRDRAAEAAAIRADAPVMRAAPSVTGDVLLAAYVLAVLIPPAGFGAGIIVGFRRPGHGLGLLTVTCIAFVIETMLFVAAGVGTVTS